MAEVETASSDLAGELRPAETAAAPLTEAVAIMARLRAPGGCPWDREQTFDTIKRHTLEETYEVFDAIERRAWPELKDELGDLLLQVLFYSQMAAEAGYFDIGDVAAGLNAKLVRRHPHVFPVAGKLTDAADADAVLRNWEQIKRAEKLEAAALKAETAVGATSGLDDIPRTMPAMLEAGKLGSRAAKVGFDWPNAEGLFEKLQEEIAELKAELAAGDALPQKSVSEEFGDLLFTAVNLARHLKVDTESALRAANAKFRARFRAMEAVAGGYDALARLTPEELDALWNGAKRGDDAEPERASVEKLDAKAPNGSPA
jgi:XTP/dITP diphosphohydrolase/ATP diphosphatase